MSRDSNKIYMAATIVRVRLKDMNISYFERDGRNRI